ncbi:SirB family protein [Thalassotalea insulae]|uniref:SirB family protein n=1 Tax=Thalassotalea insulae TaxID=2056778 RepID=A0ABQ6GVL1_9GAMM|nr:SirB2 family protein [Thalassotalea insulae]GLX79965.1 SirB family protein [Thalassotalea insulae]
MLLKHLHMTVALISVAFFTLRFAWTLVDSSLLTKKWVKVTPHLVDTLLLVLGVIMMVKLALNPFEQLWLGEKLLAVLAYIFTGYYTLKLARNRMMQILGYLGAIGWVLLIVRLAITKQALLFVG